MADDYGMMDDASGPSTFDPRGGGGGRVHDNNTPPIYTPPIGGNTL